jgi:cytochrome c oxidase subunit 2
MIEESGNPNFVYEISCDQMCGKGHTGMRGTIIVETQQEFDLLDGGKKTTVPVGEPCNGSVGN